VQDLPIAKGWPQVTTIQDRDPLAEALAQELEDALCRAIAELPARMRQCLLLRLHHELDPPQVAEVMGISSSAVGAHLEQACRRLARALRGGDPGPPMDVP
jgi:RNA polymerase sigma factor (sigma-70 family)